MAGDNGVSIAFFPSVSNAFTKTKNNSIIILSFTLFKKKQANV